MKNQSLHEGVLTIVKRLPSSRNGNPRFLCHVGGFRCRTAVDSAFAYRVQNLDGKKVRAILGTHYGVTTLAWAEPI